MSYKGKSLDGFEYAFEMLLKANEIDTDTLPSIDCLSYRPFAFQFSNDVSTWFCPAAKWTEYMKILTQNLGIERFLYVYPSKEYAMNDEKFEKWSLIGEVPLALQNHHEVCRKYYHGIKSFYLCKRLSQNNVLISDPLGAPISIVKLEDIQYSLKESDGFVAVFECTPKICVLPFSDILPSIKQWKRDISVFDPCTEILNFISYYHGNRHEQISLQYGLMNYQIQYRKTLDFFSEMGILDLSSYDCLCETLGKTLDIWKNRQFDLIDFLEKKIWTSI